jgi:hypothetical protein
MSRQQPELPPTRFDHTRRFRLAVMALAVLAVVAVLVIVILNILGAKRTDPFAPRVIDIWAVYPDDSITFMTLHYPAEGSLETLVDLAGPLVNVEADVTGEEGLGGEIVASAFYAGPGHDSALTYPLYSVQREPGGAAYGVAAQTRRSPYITIDPEDATGRIVSFGAAPLEGMRQVIVAVALPRGTVVTDVPDLAYYYNTRAGDWDVYYFNTTNATGEEAIRLTYQPDPDADPGLPDPYRIDRKRQ